MFTAEKVQSLVMMCRMLNSRAGKWPVRLYVNVCACIHRWNNPCGSHYARELEELPGFLYPG